MVRPFTLMCAGLIAIVTGSTVSAADKSPSSPFLLPVTGDGGIINAPYIAYQKSQPSATVQPKDSVYMPKSIDEITLDISEPDLTPPKKKIAPKLVDSPPRGDYQTDPYSTATAVWLHNPGGGWIDNTLHGPVSPFCFLPTYFSDDSLERFGCTHGHCVQPFLSTGEFLVRVPLLPYLMTVDKPWQHRPPDYCPPPVRIQEKALHYARNISAEGVAVETLVGVGLFLLIP